MLETPVPLAIAHRAGNSLAGLRAALALRVDVIECDVHAHRGRLEVRHLKTAGPLPFLWDRWELASASAPRLGLAELLAAGERATPFMLDIKGPLLSTARSVAELLCARAHRSPVLVCGRYWAGVDELARLPFVRPVLSARTGREVTRLLERLDDGDRDRPGSPKLVHGVSVHRSLLDRETVEWLNRRVELVMTWPVNDLRALAHVLSLGVGGVISDEAEVLAAVLALRD